ncbi:MAG: amino acid permease [Candidatus Kapabacteria bacterium]|nr:amino acid permease [Candidatus Kapabacteria bacterium]
MAFDLKFRKDITQLQSDAAHSTDLKRTLGPVNLVNLGIGAIIGAGLFSLTGIAAAEHAGPAVTISFVIAAIGCAFAGLCYAEFAAMIPMAGSAYTYAYATMGELFAWIIGWDLVLEYAVGASTVAVSWSAYVAKFLAYFNVHLPTAISMSYWQTPPGSAEHGLVNIPAMIIVFAVSLLLIRGIQESARANAIVVFLKVAVVIIFIGLGFAYINADNYTPYIPENTGSFGHFGWSGILKAAGMVFFAFIGFDAVSTAAQEAKNPQRDMPIGILGSLVICTILYVLFSYVMTGVANYTEFAGVAAPVAVAVEKMGISWLGPAINLAIIAGYSSVILVMLLGQSRVFFSMSKDGLLPKLFSDSHPKYKTPWKSNILFACVVSLFAGFAPIAIVGEMTSVGTLFAFIVVCLAVLVLRYKEPDRPRPFKTPWVPLIPVLGILACGTLLVSLCVSDWMHAARLFVWLGIGQLVYYFYSIKHSKVRKAQA